MKHFTRTIAGVFFISGCTPAGIMASESAYLVTIEETPYWVQKMPGYNNGWAAHKSDVWGGFVNPEDYLLNIRAIEKHTGCKVIPETIVNQGMDTKAAVDCK